MSKLLPIPATQVLAWLADQHPALHQVAEPDRQWLWLVIDLRGDQNKPVREAIKAQGFRFAKHGHLLPSGKLAHWGHSCDKPLRFGSKSRFPATGKATTQPVGKVPSRQHSGHPQRADPLAGATLSAARLEELAAAFA